MAGRPWTTSEVAFLREIARTMPVEDVVDAMAGRTRLAVIGEAQRAGISLRTPRGMTWCPICEEFRTSPRCPVCRERTNLERTRARQEKVFSRLTPKDKDTYSRPALGSRARPVPQLPNYKADEPTVRAQCIERERVQVGNLLRERKATQKRLERMRKKVPTGQAKGKQ